MVNTVKLISEYCSAKGIVSAELIARGLAIQRQTGESLPVIFERLNVTLDERAQEIIAEQLGMLPCPIGDITPAPDRGERLTAAFCAQHHVIPVRHVSEGIMLAVDSLFGFLALDFFNAVSGLSATAILISRTDMTALLNSHYAAGEPGDGQAGDDAAEAVDDSLPLDEAPVVQLVNSLILQAYQKRASDIHIEPMQKHVRVRFRVDGILQEMNAPEKRLQAALISRIKLMAGMNIAEKRLPQDGRIRAVAENREVDLRVSSLPAAHGESVVLRILDQRSLRLEEIGMEPEQLRVFQQAVAAPNGIILVTGPTGSGKSTTLYAVLNSMDRSRKKVLTAEDPVEYQISSVNQVQVKSAIGLSFASILRAMLRQAPDVIMVGEIRDIETARIAIQAALTGHLIFSTLHTNDAPGAVARLLDMGIEPFLVASTLQAVLAQRLIRLLCDACRQEYLLPRDESKILQAQGILSGQTAIYRAGGCPACAQTGYRGRSGIFELLVVDDAVRELIHENVSLSHIRQCAQRHGMMSLKAHARLKVLQGLTTVQELVRVTQSDIG